MKKILAGAFIELHIHKPNYSVVTKGIYLIIDHNDFH